MRRLETSQIITLISGAGIGAVLSAILVFVNNSKRNRLDFITKERSEWRKQLKNIINDLNCNEKNFFKVVNRLKSQINPYGYKLELKYNEEYYLQDGHIWDLLDKSDLKTKKEDLVYFLELLLKFDWERSKNEIYLKVGKFLFKTLILFLSFLGCCLLFYHFFICTTYKWLVPFDVLFTILLLMNLSEKIYPKVKKLKFMFTFLFLLALPEFYIVVNSIYILFPQDINNSEFYNVGKLIAIVIMCILEVYLLLSPVTYKDHYLEKIARYISSKNNDDEKFNKIQNNIAKMTYGKQYIPKRKKSELKRLKKQRLNVIKKSLRQKYTKTKQKYKIGLLKRIIKNYHVKENTHV
ncbi:hypothetical protein [Streptococcus oralis]|uniref:hypothetical protein n=1 Tax=Streptococcus oralis TaxID=1303 RepID=UPI003D159173